MKDMFKINSISKAIALIIFVISLAIFLSISASRVIRLENELVKQKEKLIDEKKETLKSYVDIAYNIIENNYKKSTSKEEIKLRVGDKLELSINVLMNILNAYYEQNKNTLSNEVLKDNIRKYVKAFRGPNNEYFWITDDKLPYPTMIMHPISPALDGSVLNKLKYNCAMGTNQNLFQAMVEVCKKSGSGYVDYVWNKPTDNGIKPNQPKLSYVKMFKPFNWVIGTGAYIDDIEDSFKKECLNLISKMRYNNGTGYFWVNDDELPYPKMLMHPTSPKLNGKILNNVKYNCAMGKGQNLFQAMVEVCNKQGEGFVDYIWDKPTKEGLIKDQPKLSFVKKFEQWHWIVGSGIYVDDINEMIALERNKAYKDLLFQLVLLFLAFVVMFVVMQLFFRKIITRPVKKIQNAVNKLSKGIFPEVIDTKLNNEIGDITKAANSLIVNLSNVKDFAKAVGHGNLDTKFEKLSEDDELGTSLLDMRENLLIARNEEEKRKKEDAQRNWATQGVAKFAEILRNNNEDIEQLSYSIISNLVNYLGANQGGIFLLNNNDVSDDKNLIFKMEACYAYNRKKFLQKEIEWGEGLVGRCGLEKQTILLTDIPDDYIEITSGLGDANPTSLILVPLMLNEEIYGVIEIASFKIFEDYQIEFVEKVGESIASTISTVQINNKTKILLEQSQQQTEEMKAQEEEMRQNLEEMQATQEEMAKSKKEAEIAINTLNSIANPVISIDKDFNVTYINDAGVNVSGVSRVNALNKKCYDLWRNPHCNTNECRCAIAMKTKKSETGKTFVEDLNMKIIYTGTPLFDEDGDVVGVIEEIIDLDKLK